ncbi:6-phosphofructokinase [Candidatus Poribacteria bacterium]|nr:6-phosphofructokinase [Candidatus Poribacteria bacterium]
MNEQKEFNIRARDDSWVRSHFKRTATSPAEPVGGIARPSEDPVKLLYEALKNKLGEPGEWQWLFTPDSITSAHKQLINTTVERLNLEGRHENPTLHEPDKPRSAFVREGACIPVLHDWDIMQVFVENNCLNAYPRFLRAGEQPVYRFDPTNVKVGILIAGGIAAGLNMAVDSIVKRHFSLATRIAGGERQSLRIYGYDGGYKGMMQNKKCFLVPSEGSARRAGYYDDPTKLMIRATDPLAASGGSTLLKTGRGEDLTDEHAIGTLAENHAKKIVAEGLDILYVIGGNGTLGWAGRIYEALERIPNVKPITIVGGPKTMDNDVFFTDATFGFRTAVDQATEFVLAIHADAESQDRIGLVEVFGAATGWVGLHACADSGEGDEVLIRERLPEKQEDYDVYLKGILDYVEKRLEHNDHAVVVVTEGAMPEYKWRDAGAKDRAFANLLSKMKQRYGPARADAGKEPFGISDVRTRYLVRGTPPNTYDIELCKVTGRLMVDTALAGFTGCGVHRWQNDYVLVPFHTATERLKEVPVWDIFLQTFFDRLRVQRVRTGDSPPPH